MPNEFVDITETVDVQHRHQYYSVVPSLRIYSWDVAEYSPSGNRHIGSGHFAFESDVTAQGYLDFGKSSGMLSNTKCLTFKVDRPVTPFGVTNVKLWRYAGSGLGTYGFDYSINVDATPTWTQNKVLASGQGEIMEEALPSSQNIYRNDGSAFIDGGAENQYLYPDLDENTSEFIYLSLNFRAAGFDNGRYGVGGTASVGLRITYDYYMGNYHL